MLEAGHHEVVILQVFVKHLSGSHQADVRQLSDSHQAVVQQSSGSCQAVFTRLHAFGWQLSVNFQAGIRQSSGSQKKFLAHSPRFSSLPTPEKGVSNHANPMHQLNDSQQTEPRKQSKGSSNTTQLVSE